MANVLVTGAGGFIGHHLIKRIVAAGDNVTGIDTKYPVFEQTHAQRFIIGDLRDPAICLRYIRDFDEVYALAADMGGIGYIDAAECEIMRNNALININTIDAAARTGVLRYFFSSSVCVYRDMEVGEAALGEDEVIPANPDNEYGWEKLYAERMAIVYGRRYGTKVRIGRFENCYGPYGSWRGGREKAPAAICRKVAEAKNGGAIEVWGDGTAIRVFTYIDDLVAGVIALMQSELEGPVNIGGEEKITVDDLVKTVIEASGKKIGVAYILGPAGVKSRNFSKARIRSLGWEPKISFEYGIARTYKWIEDQVNDREMTK